jgi:hypothetical protein
MIPFYLALALCLVAADVRGQDQSGVDQAPQSTSAASSAPDALRVGNTEWTVSAVAAWGVPVFGYGIDNAFSFPSLSWGRVLTDVRGAGPLRGRFEWAIEVIPFFAQYDPERAYGVGISPLIWRWNFEPHGRWSPFAELGGGLLWTNVDLPSETTHANYTLHGSLAVRVLGEKARGALLGYRFEHISNGNRVDPNPSVNAHAIVVGWSMFRRP